MIPDGMVEVWTVERLDADDGIYIEDLLETKEDALDVIALKPDWFLWSTERIIAPYRMNQ